ncbi:DoxX family protein [Halomicrobium katesii]|uniref:DoxX family protein n=1 Tax=Halomicrobium katesii TaxID=437163 RepID=UPI000365A61B|nr:DoxX family membrane protein [Halomicrobium katesii]
MIPLQSELFASAGSGELFLLARLLFGGVLAFMGMNHFTNTADMVGYAQFKGLPAPKLSVVGSGGLLLFAGAGIAVGAFPVLSGFALGLFLLLSAVTMHDFWSMDDPEERQNEMTSFLKNLFGAGGAFAFAALGAIAWPYSVGLALF